MTEAAGTKLVSSDFGQFSITFLFKLILLFLEVKLESFC